MRGILKKQKTNLKNRMTKMMKRTKKYKDRKKIFRLGDIKLET